MGNFHYEEISKCRICGSKELANVIDLGNQCLTGVFPKQRNENVHSGPLELVRCSANDGCGLVQLKQSYNTDLMYGENYGYRSGLNESMILHLSKKINRIENIMHFDEGDVVIDIGSNDATTLHAYKNEKIIRIGVDPTGSKFSEYYSDDMILIPEFFNYDSVEPFLEKRKAKVITSFSMFYDLEDPLVFAEEIKKLLAEDGIWVLEQSYLGMMLSTNSFDTICHEHLEFYSLRQIDFIMKKVGLKIIDVEFNDINGGSFSVTVSHINFSSSFDENNVQKFLQNEALQNFGNSKTFDEFRERVENCKFQLIELLEKINKNGGTVYGLGASTKGNVLLQYFGIDESLVSKIAEVNPNKFGSFTPGTKIPIISEDQALNEKPDFFLVLPWHFKKFFLNSEKFKETSLIFPLPKLDVIRSGEKWGKI